MLLELSVGGKAKKSIQLPPDGTFHNFIAPQNLGIGEFYVFQEHLVTDFEALNRPLSKKLFDWFPTRFPDQMMNRRASKVYVQQGIKSETTSKNFGSKLINLVGLDGTVIYQ